MQELRGWCGMKSQGRHHGRGGNVTENRVTGNDVVENDVTKNGVTGNGVTGNDVTVSASF